MLHLSWGRIQHGYSLALEGKTEPGIAEMLEGLTTVHAAHALAALAQSHCWLSESYAAAGRAEDARKALADGFAAMENTGERMFEAELHRVKGEIALICEPPELSEAERSFRIAIDTARSSGAKLWEIRAANSLAALLSKQGRSQEAVATVGASLCISARGGHCRSTARKINSRPARRLERVVGQNTFTIVTRINPGDLDALDRLLSEIGQEVEKNERIRFAGIASLHMAGIVIAAQDPRFAPILIFESNFDGTADEYLRELVSHGRAGIDEIYSKCEGYPAEAARTDTSVVAYLRQHGQPAAAFFVGLPGQTVASIRNAIAVREEINRFLDAESAKNSIQGLSACAIRDRIVSHLEHDSPVKPEIPPNTFSSYRRIAQRNTIIAAGAALVVGVILFPLLVIWVLAVRWREVHEQKIVPPADPPVDARTYAMEDLFIQNHLATIGVVKDNPVRRFSIRTAVALTGILFQRILLRGGFGGVFTLHFAHPFRQALAGSYRE